MTACPPDARAVGAATAGLIDVRVLGATVNASFKLFLICAVVGALLRSRRIPNSTATVLSQVRCASAWGCVPTRRPPT